VEIGEPTRRTETPNEENLNNDLLKEEVDLVEELREGAALREASLKQKIVARHDKRVIKREFEVGSLVKGNSLKIGKVLIEYEQKQKMARTSSKTYTERKSPDPGMPKN
jgi:hypothetical protein